jgi:hypothetical protein
VDDSHLRAIEMLRACYVRDYRLEALLHDYMNTNPPAKTFYSIVKRLGVKDHNTLKSKYLALALQSLKHASFPVDRPLAVGRRNLSFSESLEIIGNDHYHLS